MSLFSQHLVPGSEDAKRGRRFYLQSSLLLHIMHFGHILYFGHIVHVGHILHSINFGHILYFGHIVLIFVILCILGIVHIGHILHIINVCHIHIIMHILFIVGTGLLPDPVNMRRRWTPTPLLCLPLVP